MRPERWASPERWQRALVRATRDGIQVRQLAGCGAWIATSGSQAEVAYELLVTGTVAHGCSCLAGSNGDPVCKHRAAFYHEIGLLDFDPEPAPPAPAVACRICDGTGELEMRTGGRLNDYWRWRCRTCDGTGKVAPAAA